MARHLHVLEMWQLQCWLWIYQENLFDNQWYILIFAGSFSSIGTDLNDEKLKMKEKLNKIGGLPI